MKSQLLVIDTFDDRRELRYLIGKLSPADRVNFLTWACRQAPQGRGRLPVPCVQVMQDRIAAAYRCDRADLRLSNEVYCDLLSLFHTFSVPAAAVACEAEKWVRRPAHRTAAVSALRRASRPAAPSRTPGTGT